MKIRKYIRRRGKRAADKIQGIWEIPGYTNGGFVIEYAHILGISSGIFEILFNYNEVPLIIMPKRQNRYVTICWRAVCI